jgi:choline kinase
MVNWRPAMRDLQAVILAAGVASRLRPLTDTTPKCLLDLGGSTLLERTLENLQLNGVRNIVIVTGFLEDQIRAFVRNRMPDAPVRFVTNPQYAITNNIYSLWLARAAVEPRGLLLLDSDILFDADIIRLCMDAEYDNCLALKSGMPLGPEEIKVRTDACGVVREIGKDVNPAAAAGESIGIELFGPNDATRLFAILHEKIVVRGQVGEFYEAAFQEAIDAGTILHAVDVGHRPCMEIDTVEDFTRARELVRHHRGGA